MSDEEHLSLIRQGVAVWNHWRKDNPGTSPDLIGANLIGANLIGADLIGADLSRAYLSGAYLYKADLRRVYLSGANLYKANLGGADLSAANLSAADLSAADLSAADLGGADLSLANLSGADLSLANLGWARMGWSVFGNIDLSQVKGLDSIRHEGPSTVGIDTIYRSMGNIPEKFLRGCGLSDMQIAMAKLHRRGLTNEEVTDLTYDIHHLIVLGAIHSHSTFISYSMKDQVFADKLYDDLQNHGVRCWFATEDMPIGGKLRDEIDHAISRRENVVLILSENALNSRWVEDEVEKAFEVEKERGQRILLPVRLDNTVLETDKPWARKICRRLVGDFRGWADDRVYRREFDRLLRGIKAAAEAED